MRRIARLLSCSAAMAAGVLLANVPAGGEELVVALSTREVAITSTYSGAEITLFGAIERDARTIARSGGYDVVANVQGPAGTVMVEQKGQFGPLWLNMSRQRFTKIPLFFAVLTSRPLNEAASPDIQSRLKLGLDHFLPPNSEDPRVAREESAFRAALLRLREAEHAALIDDKAIAMLRPNIFTAKLSLPATAPTGLYVINVTLMAEGVPLKTAQAGFVVRKVGFDAFLARASRTAPWTYGFLTIVIAIVLGWTANLMFRRE